MPAEATTPVSMFSDIAKAAAPWQTGKLATELAIRSIRGNKKKKGGGGGSTLVPAPARAPRAAAGKPTRWLLPTLGALLFVGLVVSLMRWKSSTSNPRRRRAC